MKKSLLIAVFFLLIASLPGWAQRITNVQATVKDDQVLIGYQIKGLQCEQSVEAVNFYVSKDGGRSFVGPLNEISGDTEPGLRNGKYIVSWEALKEMPFSEEKLIFDVRAEIDEKKRKRAIMLSYVGNVNTQLGGRIGQLGKVSWYLEGRFSTLFNQNTQYSYSGNNLEQYDESYQTEATEQDGWKAYSAIVGTTIQTDCNFFIYLGMGFGSEKYIKKFDEFDENNEFVGSVWAIDENKTMQGVELDGGLIFRYKKLLISGGVTILNLERYNWTMGLGVAF